MNSRCPDCLGFGRVCDDLQTCSRCGGSGEPRDTFTTQEGDVFGMEGATCPNGHASELAHRVFPSGYFRCPECDVLYDEPTFNPDQYVTTLQED